MRKGIEVMIGQVLLIAGVVALSLVVLNFYSSYTKTITKKASEKGNVECNVSDYEAQQVKIQSIEYPANIFTQNKFYPNNEEVNETFSLGGEIMHENITLPKNVYIQSAVMSVRGYGVE